MRSELYAAICRDLAIAAFLWRRYPRQARRLMESAAEVLYWLG